MVKHIHNIYRVTQTWPWKWHLQTTTPRKQKSEHKQQQQQPEKTFNAHIILPPFSANYQNLVF